MSAAVEISNLDIVALRLLVFRWYLLLLLRVDNVELFGRRLALAPIHPPNLQLRANADDLADECEPRKGRRRATIGVRVLAGAIPRQPEHHVSDLEVEVGVRRDLVHGNHLPLPALPPRDDTDALLVIDTLDDAVGRRRAVAGRLAHHKVLRPELVVAIDVLRWSERRRSHITQPSPILPDDVDARVAADDLYARVDCAVLAVLVLARSMRGLLGASIGISSSTPRRGRPITLRTPLDDTLRTPLDDPLRTPIAALGSRTQTLEVLAEYGSMLAEPPAAARVVCVELEEPRWALGLARRGEARLRTAERRRRRQPTHEGLRRLHFDDRSRLARVRTLVGALDPFGGVCILEGVA